LFGWIIHPLSINLGLRPTTIEVGQRFLSRSRILRPMRCLIRAKIHRATVTDANPDYVGSITVDDELLQRADIWPGERVLVADVNNGARFETYTVSANSGSGVICVNGSAARLVKKGDKIIIMAFEYTDRPVEQKVVLVDEHNRFLRSI
jgi:aspartate 1-decarboxylase